MLAKARRERAGSLELELWLVVSLLMRIWEQNSDTLEVQEVLLTTETSC